MNRPRSKPEHLTHLDHRNLVRKDHPRIVFRGWIDRLEGEILLCALTARENRYPTLAAELEELLDFVRHLIRADVLAEPVKPILLAGYDPDTLREYSHHPETYFGQGHFLPLTADGPVMLSINRLRSLIRQSEIAAYRAFRDYSGAVTRPDILQTMNRLSSLCWIWQIKLKAGLYPRDVSPP